MTPGTPHQARGRPEWCKPADGLPEPRERPLLPERKDDPGSNRALEVRDFRGSEPLRSGRDREACAAPGAAHDRFLRNGSIEHGAEHEPLAVDHKAQRGVAGKPGRTFPSRCTLSRRKARCEDAPPDYETGVQFAQSLARVGDFAYFRGTRQAAERQRNSPGPFFAQNRPLPRRRSARRTWAQKQLRPRKAALEEHGRPLGYAVARSPSPAPGLGNKARRAARMRSSLSPRDRRSASSPGSETVFARRSA